MLGDLHNITFLEISSLLSYYHWLKFYSFSSDNFPFEVSHKPLLSQIDIISLSFQSLSWTFFLHPVCIKDIWVLNTSDLRNFLRGEKIHVYLLCL